MIENTFVHMPRVSSKTELNIWRNKIYTWQDFLDNPDKVPFPGTKRDFLLNQASDSIVALKDKDFGFFQNLPKNQHWRMFDVLNTCFLDIETTGLSKYNDDITLIGIHGNNNTKIFENGKNLEKFDKELKKYDMIVTFNGKCFDVPFIKNKFPDSNIPIFHSDLRFIMADLGFRGGLKNIEVERGISRAEDIKNVTGFDAVILWRKYQRGDNAALETLKKYLTADVENLAILMDKANKEMKQKHFYNKITYNI